MASTRAVPDSRRGDRERARDRDSRSAPGLRPLTNPQPRARWRKGRSGRCSLASEMVRTSTGGGPELDVGLERQARMAERWRHDADDFVRVLVDSQGSSEDVGIGAEASPPQSIADDRGGGDAGDFVTLGKCPTERRRARRAGRSSSSWQAALPHVRAAPPRSDSR